MTRGTWDDVQIFRDKGARAADPKITITKNFTLLFGSAFWMKAGLKNKKRVILGYSPSNNAIVFDFTEDEKVKEGFALIHRNKRTAFSTCRSFFHTMELDSESIVGRYVPHMEKIPKLGDCWVIKLDEKIKK